MTGVDQERKQFADELYERYVQPVEINILGSTWLFPLMAGAFLRDLSRIWPIERWKSSVVGPSSSGWREDRLALAVS